MSQVRRIKRSLLVFAAMAVAVTALAACGSSSSSSSSSSATTAESSGSGDSGGETSTAAVDSVTAKAEELIAPYVGQASPIPASEPLKEKPPADTTFVYVDCAAPECAVVLKGVEEATKAMGVQLKVVHAGASAPEIDEAFESAAQLKPDAVLDIALDPTIWPNGRKQLEAAGIPVVAWTIPQDSGDGLYVFNGKKRFEDTGRLMAAWVVAKSEGDAHITFFWTPDFTVFKGEAEAFKEEVENLCSDCTVEIETSPSTTIGSTLPSKVVSNLQQHPETNWAVFAFGSMVQGVPQAMAAAGVEAEVFSQAAGEPNWQYMKEGKQEGDFSGDIAIEAWVATDIAARLAIGQKLPETELNGSTPQQFLTDEEIDFDPAEGFHPYPDYQATFEKLWEGK